MHDLLGAVLQVLDALDQIGGLGSLGVAGGHAGSERMREHKLPAARQSLLTDIGLAEDDFFRQVKEGWVSR